MGRLDLLHVPSVVKGIPDLLLGDTPRPLGSRLLIGEAEEIQQPASTEDFRKAPNKDRSFFIAEGMEQAAVDHRVELSAELTKLQGVGDDEMGVDFSVGSFGLRSLDDNRHEIDAPALMASACKVQDILAGAASYVEDAAMNEPRLGQFDDIRLRSSGIPRCLALVHLLEMLVFHDLQLSSAGNGSSLM